MKELPGGGQGKVNRVINKLDFLDCANNTVKYIKNLTGVVTQPNKEAKFDELLIHLPKFLSLADINTHNALKELHDPSKARDPELASLRMEREIAAMKLLSKLDHPNIIKLIDYNEDDLWFVTKFYVKGSIEHNREKFKCQPFKVLSMIKELLSALKLLHDNNFIHRDIKPENIFVSDVDKLILGDFGLVYPIIDDNPRPSMSYDNVGSHDWEPPWAYGVRLDEINPTFDLFSIGKVIWSMISGKHILQLWYYKEDHNNLEKIYPNEPSMVYVNELLSHLIVQYEEDCLGNVNDLIKMVGDTIKKIENDHPRLDIGMSKKCPECHEGLFVLLAENDNQSTKEFGLNPSGSRDFLIFECSNCGYIQLFGTDGALPPAWNDSLIATAPHDIDPPTD
ncbi:MAG: protein kinase [Candidatus Marinimicrobia bacterium]|nr:protein kinase [Candidatus Neomarinimicrobiota bacterium]